MATAARTALDVGLTALLDALGEAATYTHAGSAAKSIDVVFMDDYQPIVPLPGGDAFTVHLAAECDYEDVSDAKVNDTLVVGGTTYYVLHPELHRSVGRAVLILSESPVSGLALRAESGAALLSEGGVPLIGG